MIVLIAAVADNGVIGAGGAMPWHLPEDLRRFQRLTTGHPLVMGRRTFESIGRALPGRRTIVVTRTPGWGADGVAVAGSVDEALALALDGDDAEPSATGQAVYVAGGGEVYAQSIDRADRLEITHVHRDVVGDTVFPAIDPDRWRRVASDDCDGFTFATYEPAAGEPDA